MAKHTIALHEVAEGEDELVGDEPTLLRPYRVTAEAGLFKRGRLWERGEQIELDPRTAANFLAVDEIEEIDGE